MYENETDFPADVKAQLQTLRDASTAVDKPLSELRAKVSDDELLNYNVQNSKIIDDKTGSVVNQGNIRKAMSDTPNTDLSTSGKIKNFVTSKKWWIVGCLIIVVIFGVVYYYYRKRGK